MMELFKRLNKFFDVDIWEADLSKVTPLRVLLIKTIRLVYGTYREFKNNELDMRAMGLVYSTLLALVPLLALSFSLLKAFGVHNQLKQALGNFLLPLGDRGPEIAQKLIGFVDNIKIGVLSAVGLGLLIYTVIRLIQKVEDSVNYIWKIDEPRSLARRFSDYMSIVLTGPVLVFIALSLKAVFLSHAFIQKLINIHLFEVVFIVIGQIIPFVFICLSFTFIIIFIPNTRVRFKSALLGGLISGTTWQITAWIFSSMVVKSARYIAIYSSFAVLFFFILWLYFNWLIVLIGSEVAYCHQHLNSLSLKREIHDIGNRLKEKLSLGIMCLIGGSFRNSGEKLTASDIAANLGYPLAPVNKLLALMEEQKLIHPTIDDPPYLMPSRELSTIKIAEVLNSVRGKSQDALEIGDSSYQMERIETVMKRVDDALVRALEEETLEDLILGAESREREKGRIGFKGEKGKEDEGV